MLNRKTRNDVYASKRGDRVFVFAASSRCAVYLRSPATLRLPSTTLHVHARGWHGKIFCTHRHSISTILSPSPSASRAACLYSVIMFVLLPIPIRFFSFCILFFFTQHFVCRFFVLRQGCCNKTSVQQTDHSSSATYMFAVHTLLIFPLNVITAKRHYRYHGITASCLPPTRYYREIFPVLW